MSTSPDPSDDADIALALERERHDTGVRHTLDEVLEHFGITRAELDDDTTDLQPSGR